MMLQGIHVKHDVMCGEAVIDQSPGGQQQSFVADVKYKSLSINLAKDIKNDYYDHYYDSALTDGVLFQNYFLPQVVPSQPSEDGQGGKYGRKRRWTYPQSPLIIVRPFLGDLSLILRLSCHYLRIEFLLKIINSGF